MPSRRSVFAAISLSVLAVPASAAPPTEGTISVAMAGAEEGDDAAADQFRTAAAQALATKGFTLLEGAGHAAYRMELSVHVSDAGTGMAKVAPTKPGLLNGMMGAVGSGVKIESLPTRPAL